MLEILFATDGSEGATGAGEWIEAWRLAGRAHVTVCTVVPPLHFFSPSLVVPTTAGWAEMPLLLQDEARKARQIAEGAAARLRERGAEVECSIGHGPPALQILTLAAELPADLVVLGAHGQAGLTPMQIGSVALNVAQLAPCSTLVVRAHTGHNRLLLAVDGSQESERATESLASLPLPEGQECIVLHVLEPGRQPNGEEIAPRLAAANQMVEQTVTALAAAGIQAAPRVQEGYAAQEIIRSAKELEIDLVVVGARGTSALQDFDLGSVSARVLRYAPCSVMIAR
jgi:nucleotide-binding universal stress UspA family protein